MTLTSASPPRPDFPRDGYGRPLITPRDGGKPVAYTRCTTYVAAIEDGFGIARWKQRLMATGLIRNKHLRDSAEAHLDNTRTLDTVLEDAFKAAGGEHKAAVGTALHELTERIDRGETVAAPYPGILEGYAVDAILDAYRAAMAPFKIVAIEQPLVFDQIKVAGTADRLLKYGPAVYVGDVKTGSVDLGTLKIAAQIAVYARSMTYDVKTGDRTIHGASTERGLLIHLPAVTDPAEARCDLYWIDLTTGWQEGAFLAGQVRQARQIKFAQLTTPFEGKPGKTSLRTEKRKEAKAEERADVRRAKALEAIAASTTPDLVRECWTTWLAVWNDELTAAAKARIQELTK